MPYWMINFNWFALWCFLLFVGLFLFLLGDLVECKFIADVFIFIGGFLFSIAIVGVLIWMAIYSFYLMLN